VLPRSENVDESNDHSATEVSQSGQDLPAQDQAAFDKLGVN
jgi:hypothetical protein